tara:strand:- start:9305 stop:10390 length:1086 start_codon:yes stop_codon:yes gene_type:complete
MNRIFTFLNRLFSKVFALLYLLYKISKFKWFKLYSSSSDYIVWIKTSPFKHPIKYLLINDLLTDFAIIESLVKNKINYKIVIGGSIGKYSNKNIFYSVSKNCNPYNLINYSESLIHLVNQLSNQGNSIFPKEEEIRYWENKGYMHRQFEKLNIPHPKTLIVNKNFDINNFKDLEYPILIKEVHSAGSKGVYKIENRIELEKNLKNLFSLGSSEVLIQNLVNMRRDLRVVILKDEVISYYWRINSTNEWKPTATSYGNSTKFGDFPEKWRSEFISYLNKMKLTTGAFDIAWDNDDVDNTPLILEVSPAYQINPVPPKKYSHIEYKNYKKKLFVRDAYHVKYVDVVFENIESLIKIYLKKDEV